METSGFQACGECHFQCVCPVYIYVQKHMCAHMEATGPLGWYSSGVTLLSLVDFFSFKLECHWPETPRGLCCLPPPLPAPRAFLHFAHSESWPPMNRVTINAVKARLCKTNSASEAWRGPAVPLFSFFPSRIFRGGTWT